MKKMSAILNLNLLNFVAPALFSWECILKITKIELKLLTDCNMILDYRNDIRRGIRSAIGHYGEADNKYIHDHDETKESTHIQYLYFSSQY